jgi:hypothetical protein
VLRHLSLCFSETHLHLFDGRAVLRPSTELTLAANGTALPTMLGTFLHYSRITKLWQRREAANCVHSSIIPSIRKSIFIHKPPFDSHSLPLASLWLGRRDENELVVWRSLACAWLAALVVSFEQLRNRAMQVCTIEEDSSLNFHVCQKKARSAPRAGRSSEE